MSRRHASSGFRFNTPADSVWEEFDDDEEYINKLDVDGQKSRARSIGIGAGAESNLQVLPSGTLHRQSSASASYYTRRRSSDSRRIVESAEWVTFRLFSGLGGFDLEFWWRRSNTFNRVTALLVMFLLAATLAHFAAALGFFFSKISRAVRNPYLCRTELCYDSSAWLRAAIKPTVEPCDNFYQFVCGNFREQGEEGNFFSNLVTEPSYKVELGEANLIGVILKNFQNDKRKDQHIIFYKSCLNYPTRAEFGLTAFVDQIALWFGTRNFADFESAHKPMEEIATSMLHGVGHATYLNFAFFAYPYLQILEPLQSALHHHAEIDEVSGEYIRRVFSGLMPHFGLSSNSSDHKAILDEMVSGVDVFSSILYKIYHAVVMKKIPQTETSIKNPPSEITNIISSELAGYCPPMGIKLDLLKVIDMFIGEEYKLTFVTPTARKFAMALQACLDSSGSFTAKSFTYPNAAFVAIWLLDSYHQLFVGMDYKGILKDWKLDELADRHSLTRAQNETANFEISYACVSTLFGTLGELANARFLTSTKEEKGNVFISQQSEKIQEAYGKIRGTMSSIPLTEIHWKIAIAAKSLYRRGFHMNIAIPLIGDVIDEGVDDLNFTEDFLRNVIISFNFTIRQSRLKWSGSTLTDPNIKWWGHGGPGDIFTALTNPRLLRISAARLIEEPGAALSRKWEKFLGRDVDNYVIYPLSLFDTPHADETLSLKNACTTAPILHSILVLLREATSPYNYRSVTWDELIGNSTGSLPLHILFGNSSEVPENLQYRECEILLSQEEEISPDRFYEYQTGKTTISDYSWGNLHHDHYIAMLALKLAYKHFQQEVNYLNSLNYTFDFPKRKMAQRKQKVLPGPDISKYDSKQLFFIAYARQLCREDWKLATHSEVEKKRHYLLEVTVLSILRGMQEFSDAWKCPKDSFMSNAGKQRCMDWVPDHF